MTYFKILIFRRATRKNYSNVKYKGFNLRVGLLCWSSDQWLGLKHILDMWLLGISFRFFNSSPSPRRPPNPPGESPSSLWQQNGEPSSVSVLDWTLQSGLGLKTESGDISGCLNVCRMTASQQNNFSEVEIGSSPQWSWPLKCCWAWNPVLADDDDEDLLEGGRIADKQQNPFWGEELCCRRL